MSITLYDISAAVPGRSLSPNVFKTRLALAYKGLSFKTEWLELSEIESRMKELGADPTSTWEDGRPKYTLPVIQDHTTGRFISDSMNIAYYLDETYPERPTLFPHGARAPIVMLDEFFPATAIRPGGDIFSHGAFKAFAPPSIGYIRSTRGDELLARVASLQPQAREPLWAAVRDGFSKVAKILSANGEDLLFFYGSTPSFADFIVAGYLHYMEVSLGVDSKEWKDVKDWDGGRWARLLQFTGKLKVLGE